MNQLSDLIKEGSQHKTGSCVKRKLIFSQFISEMMWVQSLDITFFRKEAKPL